MTPSELDFDARRLETWANDLILRLNLEAAIEKNSGLIASYNQKEGKFLVEDGTMSVSWSVPFSHMMKQSNWDEIYCWIMSFSSHGCTMDHTHYSPY